MGFVTVILIVDLGPKLIKIRWLSKFLVLVSLI